MNQPSPDIIALKILQYMDEHPDAQDTLDGIIEWWLLRVDIKYQKDLIGEVLRDLMAKDLIFERKQLGSVTYKLNSAKRDKISDLLNLIKREPG